MGRCARGVSDREIVLGFLSRVGRPVTGGEIRDYGCRGRLRARELRALMAELEAEGLVTAEPEFSSAALDRVSWTYRLTPPPCPPPRPA